MELEQHAPYSGKIIVLDGSDAAGKDTQIELTRQYLESQGFKVTVVREQYDLPECQAISDVNLHTKRLTMMTRLHLYQAMRYQTLYLQILPAIQAGHVVLMNRFIYSTLAYQGFEDGEEFATVVKKNIMQVIDDFEHAGASVDTTFILLLPPERAQDRLKERGAMDVIESWNMDRKRRVYKAYRLMADLEPVYEPLIRAEDHMVGVNADNTIEGVFERIKYRLDKHFIPTYSHSLANKKEA